MRPMRRPRSTRTGPPSTPDQPMSHRCGGSQTRTLGALSSAVFREVKVLLALGWRAPYPNAGVMPRWPQGACLGRAGCPPRGGLRRACGAVQGRNRGGLPQGGPGRPKRGPDRGGTLATKARSLLPSDHGVCGRHGTEEHGVTSGGLAGSPAGAGVSNPRSDSEMGRDARSVVGPLNRT